MWVLAANTEERLGHKHEAACDCREYILSLYAIAELHCWRRYEAAQGARPERLASGSDDFTMFLWEPSSSQKPLARMTGHLQLINQVDLLFLV
jgi:hypothetical protein